MYRIETYREEPLFQTAKRGQNKGNFKGLALALPAMLLVLGLGTGTAEAQVCKSSAYEKKDAITYCDGQLGCTAKKLDTTCNDKPRRYICRCTKPKPTGGQNNIEGLLLDSEDNSAALLGALANALNGFEGQQHTDVSTPYTEPVPSALEAAQQDNRDREHDLARAQELDQQRKRDQESNHDNHDYPDWQESETETEIAANTGEDGTPSETGDSTGIFQVGDYPATETDNTLMAGTETEAKDKPKPDLVISLLEQSSLTFYNKKKGYCEFGIKVRVQNAAKEKGAKAGKSTLNINVDHTTNGAVADLSEDRKVKTLKPKAQGRKETYTGKLRGLGTYKVTATADSKGVVDEGKKEGNNAKSINLTCAEKRKK